jgi:hypothetical protein
MRKRIARPDPWSDVFGGVIQYNALVDNAGQQHVLGECYLIPWEVAWALSDCWTSDAQPLHTQVWHG